MLEANTKGNKNMFPRHFAIKLKLASRRHMESRGGIEIPCIYNIVGNKQPKLKVRNTQKKN